MIKITFKEFFNSKEKLGIICKSEEERKHVLKMSKEILGKDIFTNRYGINSEYEFAPWDYAWGNVGITFTNYGEITFLERNNKVCKMYEFEEVAEVILTKEQEDRLLRWVFGYSFRYNPERRTTTLYKAGKKVRVVVCHEEDVFDWKVGLSLCIYRYAYMGKNAGVDYLKGVLSCKKFAEYILRRTLAFNEKEYAFLIKRVKEAEPYEEIHI